MGTSRGFMFVISIKKYCRVYFVPGHSLCAIANKNWSIISVSNCLFFPFCSHFYLFYFIYLFVLLLLLLFVLFFLFCPFLYGKF